MRKVNLDVVLDRKILCANARSRLLFEVTDLVVVLDVNLRQQASSAFAFDCELAEALNFLVRRSNCEGFGTDWELIVFLVTRMVEEPLALVGDDHLDRLLHCSVIKVNAELQSVSDRCKVTVHHHSVGGFLVIAHNGLADLGLLDHRVELRIRHHRQGVRANADTLMRTE